MKTSIKPSNNDEILEHCDELRADDGISPQELAKQKQSWLKKQSRKKPNYHARQLCKQIHHAVDDAIICDCGDPVLHDLRVESVCQSGKAGNKIEVTFVTEVESPEQIEAMHIALNYVRGILRSAVAGAITRKRVPQMTFQIIAVIDGC